MAASCWDGIPDHGHYKRLLFEAASPASLLTRIRAGDCPVQDAWQVLIHAAICDRTDADLFSDHLADEEIQQAMLKPCGDIAATVDRLLQSYGQDASDLRATRRPADDPIRHRYAGGMGAMKIVLALDSFKGSLTAVQACDIVAAPIRSSIRGVEVVTRPMAGGGEGTASALMAAAGGQWIARTVMGPLPEIGVEAGFVWLVEDKTAVVEMATASGLTLLRAEQRNPLKTATCGTGEVIREAIDYGAQRVLLEIGGSATVAGGVGAATAMDGSFWRLTAGEIGLGGGQLLSIDRIVPAKRAVGAAVEVLCDVDNPLCGERGAARVYGPQKGATPEMVETLDAALAHLAKAVKNQLGRDIAELPGAGAAEGLAAGAVAFMNARLVSGTETVMLQTRLEEALAGADWYRRERAVSKSSRCAARSCRASFAWRRLRPNRIRRSPRLTWVFSPDKCVCRRENIVRPVLKPPFRARRTGWSWSMLSRTARGFSPGPQCDLCAALLKRRRHIHETRT